MKRILVGAALGAVLVCAACSSGQQGSETQHLNGTGTSAPAVRAQPSESNPARYDLNGKVVAVDRSAKRLTVDHGDIPGFMGAMTMPYAVKDEHLLDNLKAGDQISAKVVSTGSEFWLENVAVKPGTPAK